MNVPFSLTQRLGSDATDDLIKLVKDDRQTWTEHVMTTCTERFERRLVEETSKLHVDLSELKVDLREEMATGRLEWLRWAFAFWVGQLVGVAALLGLFLRSVPGK